jgi:pimeloyl-ACP methyl ester carboxylesterase
MPLLAILRFLFMALSLLILAAGGWLIWSWLEGVRVLQEPGGASVVREDWRLWAGLALLAWSALGRFPALWILASGDTVPSKPIRGTGKMLVSPTGASLFVETTGPDDGPVLVFTHGWGLDSTIWYHAKQAFHDRFRVVTWDLAGLGRSRADRGGVNMTAFAADLRAVIDNVSPAKPVVLVGHSIGGMVIQTLCRDHPEFFRELVAGAVLVNTTYTNPLRTMVFSGLGRALQKPLLEPAMKLATVLQPVLWLAAWQGYLSGSTHCAMRFGFGRSVTRSQLDHTALLTTRNPPGTQALGNLAMFRWDATGDLSRMTGPVLVLSGDMDIVTLVDASQTIAHRVPSAELEVVEDANHMGFLERADAYHDAIAGFANVVRPRGSS